MESQTTLLFLLLLGSLLSYAHGEDLFSCLSDGGVTNITTSYTPDYLHLLVASNQNLRFTKPNVNKPIAVVLPENKNQVGTAIQCSRKWSCEIRLRSGGHSYEGLSSIADGPFVIIDLMNLNQVSVHLESETAWVEGGATLGEVYHAIAMSSKHHGFSAGLCSTVGSGGHFSGGGYGALVRKYGLAADNVVDVILVDSNGDLLDRESMGEEVFWAIRGGGGGNWGAVVGWKIRLLRVPGTVTVFLIRKSVTTSQGARLWHKWQLVAPELDDDFFLQVVINPQTSNRTNTISFTFMGSYLGPTASALATINKAFPELGVTMQDCKEMSWVEGIIYVRADPNVNTVADLKRRFSYQKAFSKSKADYVRSPIPVAGLEGALDMLAKQSKASLILDPYGGINNRIRSDAIAFPHRVGNLYAIEYFVDWEEEDGRSSEYLDGIRKLYEYMGPFVSVGPRALYVNNVDLDLGVIDWSDCNMHGFKAVEVARAWGEKYFLGNYDRLVRAKTSIDPNNVFRHPQSIPPLAYREGRVYCP
ncbi:berberine bridge enzyme-like D-2 [Magnolia sinica]|uniref:berberine bridge enzyme-like D-2 n=1 Tax=Magnolia sinica TaxID=86752 RepID=UPI00265A5538|nr:berberine bridge enzyme-like D-2 [Magnolia sinica]